MSVVLVETDAFGTRTLTINRPEVHNAINEEVVATLTAELQRADTDPAVRVVVLAAAGRSFSAGVDLAKLQRLHSLSADEIRADTRAAWTMVNTLEHLSKPSIARVQGAAFAGGITLITACDIVVASVGALFSISEVRIGLAPLVMSPLLLQRIGMAAMRRYTLTGEKFDAREALAMGLVTEVAHDDQLSVVVARYAQALRLGAPGSLATTKALLNQLGREGATPPFDDMLERIVARRGSAEAREGTSAFLEKRRPAWTQTSPTEKS
jgi:methylglutaconyl-CoA hydratase